MDHSNQSTMSPMNFLKIFFRRKFLFFIPTFFGLVLGICAGLVLPKEYKSSTIILAEEGKTDNPLFHNIAVSTTVQQRLATIRESMLGWDSLVTLVKRLNMDKDVKSTYEFEQLILDIRDKVHITMRGPNIIDLSYIGKDPDTTQAIVKNLTDIFIERNVEVQNKETSDAIRFIEEQLRVYRGKIKSAEIAKLQDQLDELMIDSTEQHPLVRELRAQIDQKKEELRQENLEYTESDVLKVQSVNPLIAEIRQALEKVEKSASGNPQSPQRMDQEVTKVILAEKLENVMARDVDVNEKIYNMLLQRLETAKITQRLQASKEGTRYTILDPPRKPLKPFKPNKLLVALAGLVFGGSVGVGLVVGTEFLDKSFLDVEDAKEYLGRPLLGAISKITTMENIKAEQAHNRWVYSITFILGVVLVCLTVTIATFLQ